MLQALPSFLLENIASQLDLKAQLKLRSVSKIFKKYVDPLLCLTVEAPIKSDELDIPTTLYYYIKHIKVGLLSFNNLETLLSSYKALDKFPALNLTFVDLCRLSPRDMKNYLQELSPSSLVTNEIMDWKVVSIVLDSCSRLDHLEVSLRNTSTHGMDRLNNRQGWASLSSLALRHVTYSSDMNSVLENNLPQLLEFYISYTCFNKGIEGETKSVPSFPKLILASVGYGEYTLGCSTSFGLADLPNLKTVILTVNQKVPFDLMEINSTWPTITEVQIKCLTITDLEVTHKFYSKAPQTSARFTNKLNLIKILPKLFPNLSKLSLTVGRMMTFTKTDFGDWKNFLKVKWLTLKTGFNALSDFAFAANHFPNLFYLEIDTLYPEHCLHGEDITESLLLLRILVIKQSIPVDCYCFLIRAAPNLDHLSTGLRLASDLKQLRVEYPSINFT